jgi:hypothetical protein
MYHICGMCLQYLLCVLHQSSTAMRMQVIYLLCFLQNLIPDAVVKGSEFIITWILKYEKLFEL